MKKLLLMAVGVLFVAPAAWAQTCDPITGICTPVSSEPAVTTNVSLPTITSKEYAEMDKTRQVIVLMFSADNCKPCVYAKRLVMQPLMQKYAQEANVHFYLLNMSHDVVGADGKDLPKEFSVSAVPAFVVFANGEKKFPTNANVVLFDSNKAAREQLKLDISNVVDTNK